MHSAIVNLITLRRRFKLILKHYRSGDQNGLDGVRSSPGIRAYRSCALQVPYSNYCVYFSNNSSEVEAAERPWLACHVCTVCCVRGDGSIKANDLGLEHQQL